MEDVGAAVVRDCWLITMASKRSDGFLSEAQANVLYFWGENRARHTFRFETGVRKIVWLRFRLTNTELWFLRKRSVKVCNTPTLRGYSL